MDSKKQKGIKAVNQDFSRYDQVKKDQTYRITVEKRNSNISSDEIISKIASNIQNKVSLEESDWIVLIEILGSEAGIAVLKAEDILSVQKTKRALSD